MERNGPVSSEITGYAASVFVYLHSVTSDQGYLEAADRAASFLVRRAWDPASKSMPFELDPPEFTYFFDCGIVVRGLVAAWRAIGDQEFLDVATALGASMATDFAHEDGGFHPVLSLPAKQPAALNGGRWSVAPGCYQLKAALAWRDLEEATGDSSFAANYARAVEDALQGHGSFLPGHPDRLRVMDRLHAFLYFLEGLLPRAGERRCDEAITGGILLVERALREIAPQFERSDVYAQLLRLRLHADSAGVAPLDYEAAWYEADRLAGFQAEDPDPRIDGGFYFGRMGGKMLPHVNPVSTAFALHALALWEQRCNDGTSVPPDVLV